jgi:hypothetical protein
VGLDFSYLLYFKQEHWLEALQKVVSIAEPLEPPTRLVFPDHEISIPMETWVHNNGVVYADRPELDFSTALFFEEDEAIQEYRRDSDTVEAERCPPSENEPRKVSIGYIYLSINNDRSKIDSPNELDHLSRFNFCTPGTRMSLLFDYSPSIRKTFVELLESIPGVCGVLNREHNGVIFWWQGDQLDDIVIDDPYLPPSEIEKFIRAKN